MGRKMWRWRKINFDQNFVNRSIICLNFELMYIFVSITTHFLTKYQICFTKVHHFSMCSTTIVGLVTLLLLLLPLILSSLVMTHLPCVMVYLSAPGDLWPFFCLQSNMKHIIRYFSGDPSVTNSESYFDVEIFLWSKAWC